MYLISIKITATIGRFFFHQRKQLLLVVRLWKAYLFVDINVLYVWLVAYVVVLVKQVLLVFQACSGFATIWIIFKYSLFGILTQGKPLRLTRLNANTIHFHFNQ